jgi:hypothetical protein
MASRFTLKYVSVCVLALLLSLAASAPAVADQFTVGPGSTCPATTVTLGAATVSSDRFSGYYELLAFFRFDDPFFAQMSRLQIGPDFTVIVPWNRSVGV